MHPRAARMRDGWMDAMGMPSILTVTTRGGEKDESVPHVASLFNPRTRTPFAPYKFLWAHTFLY